MCLIVVFVVCALAAFAGAFGFLALSGWATEAGWAIVVLTLVLGPLLSLLVHEIGHLLAGVAAGMSPVLVVVGPLGLQWRKGDNLPRLWSSIPLLGGFTLCLPAAADSVREQMIRMTVGGPVASLLLAAVATAIALSTENNFGNVAGMTGLFSMALFLVTAAPYDHRGMTSDGAKIRFLRAGGPRARSLAASQCLLSAAHEGVPPAEWPQDLIATALDVDAGTPERGSALHLAYWSALDAGEIGQAGSLLSELQSETRNLSEIIAGPAAFEAAAFYLFVRREPAAARALIEGRRPIFFQDRYVESLIRAGLALADGDWQLAALWARATHRDLRHARMFPSVSTLHARWLEQVEAELDRPAGPWDAAGRADT